MQKGRIFDIQRFSVHDGPGIRTTVFMKGCPLRCKWCHNPEGLNPSIQLQYWNEKCIGCGKCKDICEHHKFVDGAHIVNYSECTMCGRCILVCPAQALMSCGRDVTVDEVMEAVLRDREFYGKDGGVTFSGGEALLQYEFVVQAFKKLKEAGLNTTLDTSGYAKWEHIEATLPWCDLYLYDIKAFHPDIHKDATGVSNELILENLKKLDAAGKPIWIRTPVIGGVNDTDEEMTAIADFIKPLKNIRQITLMPYHTLGRSKYETLGLTYKYEGKQLLTKERLKHFENIFTDRNIILG